LTNIKSHFDIRAKRIITSLNTLALIIEVAAAANSGIAWAWAARLLYSVK